MKKPVVTALIGVTFPSCFLASISFGASPVIGSVGNGPQAAFTVSQEVLCVGNCVQFMNETVSDVPIAEWNWTFVGGAVVGGSEPEVSNEQNAEVCYESAGLFWAVLSVTDVNGNSSTDSLQLIVDPCTGPIVPDFGASDTIICAGDCVNFQNQSLGFQTTYTWIFGGINQSSTEENPQVICYDSPGTYNITLIVENGIDSPSLIVKVDFITVENCLNPPVPMFSVSQDSICVGECVDFFDESTGLGSEFFEYEWIFEGVEEGSETSIEENPSDVCYNDAGTFDVTLKVKRLSVPDSATQIFSNVITVSDSPECIPNSVEDDFNVSQNRLALFPNPAKKSVTINVQSNTANAYSLAI
ncbi:MAG: PKD domain-containing protein, partial [Cryomorphaceae bacterium]